MPSCCCSPCNLGFRFLQEVIGRLTDGICPWYFAPTLFESPNRTFLTAFSAASSAAETVASFEVFCGLLLLGCRFVLRLNLPLENSDSLLQVFRGLFVLLFQLLELLLQITSCWADACARRSTITTTTATPFELKAPSMCRSALKPRDYPRAAVIVECNHFAACPIALVNSSWA